MVNFAVIKKNKEKKRHRFGLSFLDYLFLISHCRYHIGCLTSDFFDWRPTGFPRIAWCRGLHLEFCNRKRRDQQNYECHVGPECIPAITLCDTWKTCKKQTLYGQAGKDAQSRKICSSCYWWSPLLLSMGTWFSARWDDEESGKNCSALFMYYFFFFWQMYLQWYGFFLFSNLLEILFGWQNLEENGLDDLSQLNGHADLQA